MREWGWGMLKISFVSVVVLGLDGDDLLKFWLVEVFACVFEDILGFFLEDLEEEDGDHVFEFWVFAQVGLVVDSILDLLLVEESYLCGGESLDASDVVRIVVLFLVVHIGDLVVVYVVLLLLLAHRFKFIIEALRVISMPCAYLIHMRCFL